MNEENNAENGQHPPIDTETMRLPKDNLMWTHHNHMGIILSMLILLLVVVFGGLFLWGGSLKHATQPLVRPLPTNNEPETPRTNADVQILQTTSSSDEIPAIEADLNSSNFDTLTADLDQADRELNAALPQ